MRPGLKRQYINRIGWCHICGLPIPEEITDSRHHLFGTIDHIIPLVAGGTNCKENRAPAHQLCNRMKSEHQIVDLLRKQCRGNIRAMLDKLGHAIPSWDILEARTGMRVPAPFHRMHHNGGYFYRTRWEDDGGFIPNTPAS